MLQENKETRAVAYAVRAYPADKQFFQELATKFENQQRAFKALCDNWRIKDANNTTSAAGTGSEETESLKRDLLQALNEIESLKAHNDELLIKLQDVSKQMIKHEGANINGLQIDIEKRNKIINELESKLKNPFLIELNQENADNLRRIRPFVISKGIVTSEKYTERMANLAVKYLITNEFNQYIKK